MYKLVVTACHNLVEAELAGFLSPAEVEAYAAEAEPMIRSRAARGSYRMLIDVSGCSIQSQEVVTAFQRHVARVPPARRLAVVTASPMVRMQIRRIVSGPGMEMFENRAVALAWLTVP